MGFHSAAPRCLAEVSSSEALALVENLNRPPSFVDGLFSSTRPPLSVSHMSKLRNSCQPNSLSDKLTVWCSDGWIAFVNWCTFLLYYFVTGPRPFLWIFSHYSQNWLWLFAVIAIHQTLNKKSIVNQEISKSDKARQLKQMKRKTNTVARPVF